LLFRGAARWLPVSGPRARRGRNGWPDRGVPGLPACLLLSRGGVSGELERLSRERRTPGGAGRTPAISGPSGLISRALNGTDSLITRRDPLHEPTATGTPRQAGCGLGIPGTPYAIPRPSSEPWSLFAPGPYPRRIRVGACLNSAWCPRNSRGWVRMSRCHHPEQSRSDQSIGDLLVRKQLETSTAAG